MHKAKICKVKSQESCGSWNQRVKCLILHPTRFCMLKLGRVGLTKSWFSSESRLCGQCKTHRGRACPPPLPDLKGTLTLREWQPDCRLLCAVVAQFLRVQWKLIATRVGRRAGCGMIGEPHGGTGYGSSRRGPQGLQGYLPFTQISADSKVSHRYRGMPTVHIER